MLYIKEINEECISYESEREWFEFKDNWFEKDQIGEYISSLSNSAAILGRDCACLI